MVLFCSLLEQNLGHESGFVSRRGPSTGREPQVLPFAAQRVLCQLTLLTRFGQCFLQALSSSLYARKIHRTCHPRYFLRDWPGRVNFRISESLCNSGDLGVSVVNLSRESLTTETPRTTEHSERNANLLGHRLAWPWPAILSEGGMIPGSPS